MKVGVLCECSGTVRDAFIARGHDAVSCDLKTTRRPGPHRHGDLFTFEWAGFDLLIMHPDCTFLTSAGLHWNGRVPGRSEKTAAAIDFCKRLMAFDCPRLAMENPIGCLSTAYRKPDQIIQPHQFGEDASKATCLWLKGLPLLTPTRQYPPRIVIDKNGVERKRWSNQTDSGQNKLGPSKDRAELRSITYPGIAAVMAEQWGR